jgi:PEP-CTERM motif
MKKLAAMVLVATLGAGAASADTVTLQFNSLPSAQGWTYNSGGGGSETSIFAADGTRLNQNTLGVVDPVGGGSYYTRGVTLAPTGDFTLFVDATLNSFEGSDQGGGTTYPFSFAFGLTGTYFGVAGQRLGLYSDGGGVEYTDFAPGFSPLGAHAYAIARSGGVVTLTADGVTLFSGSRVGDGSLIIGDGTKFSNALGSYSRVVFASGRVVTPAVPEPASWALMVAGFGLFGAAMRRGGGTIAATR